MSPYRKKFDAKAYWATKPLCTVCKTHKVKNGNVCSECRNAEIKKKRVELKEPEKNYENLSNMKQVDEENEINTFEQDDNSLVTSSATKKRKPISVDAQNKIVRLFTYLEKALALDDSVTRDFLTTTSVPSPFWLADCPRDIDNLHIRPFDNEKNVDDEEKITAWLRVEKKSIKPAPDLPSELVEWINEVNPIEQPKAKEKIDRKVNFDDDNKRIRGFDSFRKGFEQGDDVPENLTDWVVLSPDKLPESIQFKYVEDNWIDHQELHNLLEGYIENEWKTWAEKVRKIYQANVLYDQLYALRLLLKNEGDSYELLLGHGLLTWQHQGVGKINAPVFLTPLVIEFNPIKRVIEVVPDTQPTARPFVEISSLYEMDNPADKDLSIWADSINANPFDFWHLETLKAQSNWLINTLSTTSDDSFDDEIVSNPKATQVPSIWNAPVIFARKRPKDLWSKYAKKIGENIQRQIKDGTCELTDFVRDLIGDYEQEKKEGAHNFEENLDDISIKESELFFPLPWNDEQKRIAERIDANYGVVVKGPPGTGKSHTIANLISRFLAQGKTVLVTSQTSKALEVLRDKLPKNIQSLAVSQLEDSGQIGKKTSKEIMSESVNEISSNLGYGDTKFSNANVEKIRKEVARVREDKASLANKIRQYILTDSNEEIEIDGEKIKPIEAAKLLSQYGDDQNLAWFTDKVHYDTQLNFNQEDVQELHQLLLELESKNRNLFKFEFPALSSLPNEDVVLSAFASFRNLSLKSKISNDVFGSEINFTQEELSEIWGKLSDARKILNSINKDYEREIFDVCNLSKNEQEKWFTVLSKISEKTEIINKGKNKILGHDVIGNINFSPTEFLEAVEILKKKTANKVKLGIFDKLLLSSNAKKILENYVVDGHAPDNTSRVEILHEIALTQLAEKEIKTLLDQSFANIKTFSEFQKDSLNIVQLEVLSATLGVLVNYARDFSVIEEFCRKVKPLSDFKFTKKDDIEKIIELIASRVAKFEVISLENSFFEWTNSLRESISGNKHEVVNNLIEAIQKHNTTAWKNSYTELIALIDKKAQAVHLNEITQKVKQYSPNFYENVVEISNTGKKFKCPDNLSLAWKIARLESWLNYIHDHADIDSLQSEMERLTKREYELNSDLITTLAWQRQIKKVTKKQRDALMAWAHSMEKYGKGKSKKYAHKYLHDAQESLKEAKNAVPVWIMPLHRAAQMFSEPRAGMFDVVIFDEASQCDIRGITLGYLGKKLLVVGDPDQISPAGVFQDLDKCFELISRFLFDIPHKDTFLINSSLFALAKIRIENMIQLNEHFRSVPEIIGFSNHYIYAPQGNPLKPLRYPHPKGLLKPALVPVFVETGYQNTNNNVNEPEAKAIVDKLVECLEDPNYQKRPNGDLCTFGIISLLANDQAKYIKDLILRHPKIGGKVIEERRIVCGDAYAFQGDERDVIFLSMVKALDANNPNDTVRALADRGASQRFNVAATRARDQVFLFHSIPLTEFTNPEDWRYRLLNWFYNPKTEELDAGREALKREFESGRASQFSVDVGNLIIDRRYQVIPEYPVIGRRIDLVVQGTEARLAVECDGNQYHTLENFEDDWNRQRQLERAGWIFWRLTGSSFYRYKEKALDSLWKKLEELGIKPVI